MCAALTAGVATGAAAVAAASLDMTKRRWWRVWKCAREIVGARVAAMSVFSIRLVCMAYLTLPIQSMRVCV